MQPVFSSLGAALVTAAVAVGQAPPGTAPYVTLTDTRRTVTNFNVETIRGMAFDPTLPSRLYAINTHGSTLVYYDSFPAPPAEAQPTAIFRTVNNPSALALWDDPGSGGRYAIVVGGGTHGVAKHDRDNGLLVGYVDLPSELMDIVVDTQRDLAFVSCAGAFDDPAGTGELSTAAPSGGVVVQIDLVSFATTGGTPAGSGQHFIDGARPAFLNIEMGPGTDDNFVYVAPFLSANNTTWELNAFGDARAFSVTGLPDDDLFRIDEGGNVVSVLSGAGTLLTAHGRNPATSRYWVLGVEAFNAAQSTEPAHRGRFAENRVAIATAAASPFTVTTTVSLDGPPENPPLTLTPGTANPDKPASFPFGLAFHPDGGAFVSSSTGDVVRVLDSVGGSVRNLELPDGAIPRSLLLSPENDTLYVYAWGTNRIYGYDVGTLLAGGGSADPISIHDLGVDPAPAAVARGRRIWYDADNSSDDFAQPPVAGKVSCNTCHPRGGMDLLGWELSDPPLDRKDLMVTQSLLGIEDTFPYHWRGERSLSDFNGAFRNLLGGTELDADDLADFEAFVFSLQNPANPRQHLDRVLDDNGSVVSTDGSTGSAIEGQTTFRTVPDSLVGFQPATCAACHGLESGTNGIITSDTLSRLTTNNHLDVAHLRQLEHKFSQRQYLTPLGNRPRGGFGFTQDGNDNDILDFLNPVFFFAGLPGQTQLRVDAASFVMQFDQGIAPRAHHAILYDIDTPPEAVNEVTQVMVAQANAGHIDLVTVGHFTSIGGPAVPFAMWFDSDPQAQVFRTAEANNPGGFTATVAALEGLRQSGLVRLLVLGVPPGNGYRFAVDPDDDGLSNASEGAVTGLLPWDPDTDGDGFPDGYELANPPLDPTVSSTLAQVQAADQTDPGIASDTIDFVNGRVGKLFVSFSEPVTYDVQVLRQDPQSGAFAPFGPVQRHSARRTLDTVLVHGLLPSITNQFTGALLQQELFRVQVTMTDIAGRTAMTELPSDDDVTLDTRPTVFLNLPVPLLNERRTALTVAGLTIATESSNTVRLDIDVDNAWGNTALVDKAPGKTVVLQLLTRNASGDFAVPGGVTLGGLDNTRIVSSLTIQSSLTPPITYGPAGSAVPGPFILSPATDSGGAAVVRFTHAGIASPTRVRLVVIGILGETLPPTSPPTFEPFSERFWQMPMTANAQRAIDIDV